MSQFLDLVSCGRNRAVRIHETQDLFLTLTPKSIWDLELIGIVATWCPYLLCGCSGRASQDSLRTVTFWLQCFPASNGEGLEFLQDQWLNPDFTHLCLLSAFFHFKVIVAVSHPGYSSGHPNTVSINTPRMITTEYSFSWD